MKKIILLAAAGIFILLLQKPDTPATPTPAPAKQLGNCQACGGDGNVDAGDVGNPSTVQPATDEYDYEQDQYDGGRRRLFRGRLFN